MTIVIGSGIAGLHFALNLAATQQVLIITKKKIASSSSNLAQGGIAAVLENTDSFEQHIQDTLIAGCHHNNKAAVDFMVKKAPEAIKKLINYGVEFDQHYGKIDLGLEGGHSQRRIVHAGDHTGQEVEHTLISHIKSHPNITIWEDTFAIDLIVEDNTCKGVKVLKHNEIHELLAPHTVLATGGAGQVYQYTTNPDISTGDGYAMAHRAGAVLKDMEFIQFHPTTFKTTTQGRNFLLTEALRGEGATLLNHKHERFMPQYHKDAELAPRDIVSRAIFKEEREGPVYLTMKSAGSETTPLRFPQIYQFLKTQNLDLTTDLIPVTPAAHYICGGVHTNLQGETSIQNLYAFGEVAHTGVHGANRLASNSILEALIFSAQISQKINTTSLQQKLQTKKINTTNTSPPNIQNKLEHSIKEIMWNYAGIIRTSKGLNTAAKKIKDLKTSSHLQEQNESTLTTRNLLTLAEVIIHSAQKRASSLGCHHITTAH